MNKSIGMIGLAALGLAFGAPVQASPNELDGSFLVARRDTGNEVRQEPRDPRKDRHADKREDAPEEPQGYGYGYERRQQGQSGGKGDDRRRRDR